MKLRRERWLQ
ncbi:ribosome biogenesis protein SLX9-like protein isoform 7, partial [Daubentonia madagascariensis]